MPVPVATVYKYCAFSHSVGKVGRPRKIAIVLGKSKSHYACCTANDELWLSAALSYFRHAGRRFCRGKKVLSRRQHSLYTFEWLVHGALHVAEFGSI
jgi:hypothetical protein